MAETDNAIPDWAQDGPAVNAVPDWAQEKSPTTAVARVAPVDNQTQSDYWHNVLPDKPGETYGNILPIETGPAVEGKPWYQHIAAPEMVRSAAHGIGDLYQSAENKSTDETPDSINAMLALSGAPSTMRAASEAIPATASFIKNAAEDLVSPADGYVPPKTQNYLDTKARNSSYVQGINQNAQDMKDAYGNIYDKGRDISQGISVNEPKVQGTVSALLDNLSNDPAHNGIQGSSQAFKDLKAVDASFDENGNIPLDSVTLLKRRVDDLYGSDMDEATGKVYSTLKNQLGDVIKRAKTDNPEWGTIMDAGNNLFKNYKNTFVDDTAANDKWSLDDKNDYDRVAGSADPLGAPLSTATRERTADIANIKSLAQYESILRKLPPEMHDQFTQDVIAASKADSPNLSKRVALAYNAAKMNPVGVAKSLYGIVKSPDGIGASIPNAAQYPHIDDAIDYHSGLADNAYNNYKNPPLRLPGPPKLLSAPVSDMVPSGEPYTSPLGVSDRPYSGQMRLQTPQERDAAIAMRQNPDVIAAQRARADQTTPEVLNTELSQVGRHNSEIAAWEKAYKNLSDQNLTHKEIINKIGNKGESISALPASNPIDDEYNEFSNRNGFKRGGAVKEPTPAQKMAGNYKKHHVRYHGMDISIENLKNSERHGVDKDGKKWSAKMSDHYGYIRRTQGADGDHVDVYLGNNANSNRVYVIDQKHHDTGAFDEHKCMLGYPDRDAAVKAYRSAFSDKKNRIMKVTRLNIDEFKDWLKHGDTRKPVKKLA